MILVNFIHSSIYHIILENFIDIGYFWMLLY